MITNEQIFDAQVRQQISLLRVAARLGGELVTAIDETEPRLRTLVEQYLAVLAGARSRLESPQVQRRLRELLREIESIRRSAFEYARERARDEFVAVIGAHWEFLALLGFLVTGEVVSREAVDAREAARIVRNVPFEGFTLDQWLVGLSETDARRAVAPVSIGVVQGSGQQDVLIALFGRAALSGADGALQKTRNDLASIVRTGITHVAAQVEASFAEANEGVFDHALYTAVLDNRTTPICRSLDGNIYPIGKGPIPPVHWGCRSIRILLARGETPSRTSYVEFLKRQPQIVRDLIEDPRRELTLDQLRKFHRDSLIADGLDPGDYGL